MLQAQNLQPSVNNGRMLNMLVYVKFFKVDGFQYECTVNGFYFEIEVMVDTQMVACLIPQNVSFTTYLDYSLIPVELLGLANISCRAVSST